LSSTQHDMPSINDLSPQMHPGSRPQPPMPFVRKGSAQDCWGRGIGVSGRQLRFIVGFGSKTYSAGGKCLGDGAGGQGQSDEGRENLHIEDGYG